MVSLSCILVGLWLRNGRGYDTIETIHERTNDRHETGVEAERFRSIIIARFKRMMHTLQCTLVAAQTCGGWRTIQVELTSGTLDEKEQAQLVAGCVMQKQHGNSCWGLCRPLYCTRSCKSVSDENKICTNLLSAKIGQGCNWLDIADLL